MTSAPLRATPRGKGCEIRTMHPGQVARPPIAYLFTALPCHARTCEGRLICIGHWVCIDCGNGLRSRALVWDEPGAEDDDVDLVFIASAGGRPSAAAGERR